MKVTHSRGRVSELRLFTLWSHNKGQSAHTHTQTHTDTHRYAAQPSLTCHSCLPLRRTQWSHGRSRPGGCRSARSTRCAPIRRRHPWPELLRFLRTQTASPRTASCCPKESGRASPPPPLCRLRRPCGREGSGWEEDTRTSQRGWKQWPIYELGEPREFLFIIHHMLSSCCALLMFLFVNISSVCMKGWQCCVG